MYKTEICPDHCVLFIYDLRIVKATNMHGKKVKQLRDPFTLGIGEWGLGREPDGFPVFTAFYMLSN